MSKSNPIISPYIAFPLSYIILDALLLIFIKASSIDGHTQYNTCTANAITECLKLTVALYFVHSDNLWHEFNNVNMITLSKFLVSNLMYAVNNNLFHYSVGSLPPALYIVCINAMRTLLTSGLQPFVSGKSLTRNQIIACMLLTLSFICVSLPDLGVVVVSQSFRGSMLTMLLLLSGIYSTISVGASLAQETLLKSTTYTLMTANVINYSIGATLQISTMIYYSTTTQVAVFKGFDNFWIQMIPIIMTLSGLSIGLVLRYFDNIVKLICSSLCVLIVHGVTAFITGKPFLNVPFLFGWCLTIPATYMYNVAPSSNSSDTVSKSSSSLPVTSESSPLSVTSGSTNSRFYMRVMIAVIVAVLHGYYSVHYSSFEWGFNQVSRKSSIAPTQSVHISGQSTVCNLFEVPIDDPRSNLHSLKTFTAEFGTTFVHVDDNTLKLYVDCPLSMVKVISADIPSMRGSQWRSIEYNSTVENEKHKYGLRRQSFEQNDVQHNSNSSPLGNHVPWSSIFSSDKEPYVWLKCDLYPDANYVSRPPVPENKNKDSHSRTLNKIELDQIRKYILKDSVKVTTVVDEVKSTSAIHKVSSNLEDAQVSPIFDNVFVLYFDAVSRIKFKAFFKKSYALLQSMGMDVDDVSVTSSHTAFPLTRFHALGVNSIKNYPPLAAGVSPDNTFFDEKVANPTNASYSRRENWLFDLAEAMGYSTLAGVTGCMFNCKDNCFDRMCNNYDGWDSGGFRRQYMQDTSQRTPTEYFWPASATCESKYRPELAEYSKHTTRTDNEINYWVANKFSAAYIFDWVLTWMAAHNGVRISNGKGTIPTFGFIVLEETHIFDSFFTNFDDLLEQLLRTLFFSDEQTRKRYGLDKLAMVLLSDHGMHFGNEYRVGTGKVANKQPFAYTIVPRAFLKANPTFKHNLESNSNILTSPYDIRAMLQYWLTGRDWSNLSRNSTTVSEPSMDSLVNPNVIASKYGNSLMNVEMDPHRDCYSAGIPGDFCGCNLVPCSDSYLQAVRSQFKNVAKLVNHKIASGGDSAMEICQTVSEKDFVILPGSSSDCIVTKEESNQAVRILDIDIVVIRNNAVLSVRFEVDNNNNFIVRNINTVSKYGRNWEICNNEFKTRNLPVNLDDVNYQFCYCKSIDQYWMSWALTALAWLQ